VTSAPDKGAEVRPKQEKLVDGPYESSDLIIDPQLIQDFNAGKEILFPNGGTFMQSNQSFLDAVSRTYNENYNYLRDRDNFFQINDYMLYVESDGFQEPSNIIIVKPDGTKSLLYTTAQPIGNLSFYSEHELCFELTEMLGGYGEYGCVVYVKLDLRNGSVDKVSEQLEFGLGLRYKLYDRILLMFEFGLDTPYGEVYRMDKASQALTSNNTGISACANGCVYDIRGLDLYRTGLDGNATKLLTLSDATSFIKIYGDKLFYDSVSNGVRKCHVKDLQSPNESIIETNKYAYYTFAGEHGNIYYWGDDGAFYAYTTENDAIHIKDNFARTTLYEVGDWFYFANASGSDAQGNFKADYWRMKKDGTNLMKF
jgi:hypothetical protein